DALEVGEHPVQHDEVGLELDHGGDSPAARLLLAHLEPLVAKGRGHGVDDRRLVVDDEDLPRAVRRVAGHNRINLPRNPVNRLRISCAQRLRLFDALARRSRLRGGRLFFLGGYEIRLFLGRHRFDTGSFGRLGEPRGFLSLLLARPLFPDGLLALGLLERLTRLLLRHSASALDGERDLRLDPRVGLTRFHAACARDLAREELPRLQIDAPLAWRQARSGLGPAAATAVSDELGEIRDPSAREFRSALLDPPGPRAISAAGLGRERPLHLLELDLVDYAA